MLYFYCSTFSALLIFVTPGRWPQVPTCPPAHLLTCSPVHLGTHPLAYKLLPVPASQWNVCVKRPTAMCFIRHLFTFAGSQSRKKGEKYIPYIYICDIRGMLLTKVIHPNTYIFTAAYISLGICNSSFPRFYSWANRYDYMTWRSGACFVCKSFLSAFTCK